MPLPFLTADRAFDAGAEDVALPFDDHDSWRRPYRPGPWRVSAAAGLLLLASFVLFAAVIIGVAGEPSGALLCMTLAAVVISRRAAVAPRRRVGEPATVCAGSVSSAPPRWRGAGPERCVRFSSP